MILKPFGFQMDLQFNQRINKNMKSQILTSQGAMQQFHQSHQSHAPILQTNCIGVLTDDDIIFDLGRTQKIWSTSHLSFI